jgi:hypothetical protein
MKQIVIDSCINCPYISFNDKVPDNLEDSFLEPFCDCLEKVLPDTCDYLLECYKECPLNDLVGFGNVIVAPTNNLSEYEVVDLINKAIGKVDDDIKIQINEKEF